MGADEPAGDELEDGVEESVINAQIEAEGESK